MKSPSWAWRPAGARARWQSGYLRVSLTRKYLVILYSCSSHPPSCGDTHNSRFPLLNTASSSPNSSFCITCPIKLLPFFTAAGFANTTTRCALPLARCRTRNSVQPGSKSSFWMAQEARSGRLALVVWKCRVQLNCAREQTLRCRQQKSTSPELCTSSSITSSVSFVQKYFTSRTRPNPPAPTPTTAPMPRHSNSLFEESAQYSSTLWLYCRYLSSLSTTISCGESSWLFRRESVLQSASETACVSSAKSSSQVVVWAAQQKLMTAALRQLLKEMARGRPCACRKAERSTSENSLMYWKAEMLLGQLQKRASGPCTQSERLTVSWSRQVLRKRLSGASAMEESLKGRIVHSSTRFWFCWFEMLTVTCGTAFAESLTEKLKRQPWQQLRTSSPVSWSNMRKQFPLSRKLATGKAVICALVLGQETWSISVGQARTRSQTVRAWCVALSKRRARKRRAMAQECSVRLLGRRRGTVWKLGEQLSFTIMLSANITQMHCTSCSSTPSTNSTPGTSITSSHSSPWKQLSRPSCCTSSPCSYRPTHSLPARHRRSDRAGSEYVGSTATSVSTPFRLSIEAKQRFDGSPPRTPSAQQKSTELQQVFSWRVNSGKEQVSRRRQLARGRASELSATSPLTVLGSEELKRKACSTDSFSERRQPTTAQYLPWLSMTLSSVQSSLPSTTAAATLEGESLAENWQRIERTRLPRMRKSLFGWLQRLQLSRTSAAEKLYSEPLGRRTCSGTAETFSMGCPVVSSVASASMLSECTLSSVACLGASRQLARETDTVSPSLSRLKFSTFWLPHPAPISIRKHTIRTIIYIIIRHEAHAQQKAVFACSCRLIIIIYLSFSAFSLTYYRYRHDE